MAPAPLRGAFGGAVRAMVVGQGGEEARLVDDRRHRRQFLEAVQAEVRERRDEIEVPVDRSPARFHRLPFFAVIALPAFEAEGRFRKAEIHSPVSTSRSRSTPVLMPRPCSMYTTSSVATLA